MYKIYKATLKEHPRLVAIWESSVKATHDFLKQIDFNEIRNLLQEEYFSTVELYCAKDENDSIAGFIGTDNDKLEMLFVDDSMRGKGIGTMLINYAINEIGISKVDVNEQNKQAVDFYERCGFKTIKRNESDAQGRPYPILEMSL